MLACLNMQNMQISCRVMTRMDSDGVRQPATRPVGTEAGRQSRAYLSVSHAGVGHGRPGQLALWRVGKEGQSDPSLVQVTITRLWTQGVVLGYCLLGDLVRVQHALDLSGVVDFHRSGIKARTTQ